jgi:prophage maintenance system killer protein
MLDELIWKGNYLMWCLVTNHPFLDGNKRTAYETANILLKANGYKIANMDPIDLVNILSRTASGQVPLDDLVVWLRKCEAIFFNKVEIVSLNKKRERMRSGFVWF